MYLATLHTGHFEFVALGDTEENARALMEKAWKKHQKQFEAEWDWEFMSDSVGVTFIRVGDILRDGWLMHSYDLPAPHWYK